MKLRIVKEVGFNNPRKYPVLGSFRTNVDVEVTIVDSDGNQTKEYDNDREKLSEKDDRCTRIAPPRAQESP